MSLNHIVLNGKHDIDLQVKSLSLSQTSSPAAAATPLTINGVKCALATFSGVSIAAQAGSGASYADLVINTDQLTSASQYVLAQVQNVSTAGAGVCIIRTVVANGGVVFRVANCTGTALSSASVSILYMILN